jgi:nucleoside-diphosphate-sugar epimerase
MVERLIADGWAVRGLDLFECPVKEVEFVKGDLTDVALLERAMAGIDTVFHVAAAPYKGSRDLFWAVNVEGTQKLLDAAVAAGVKYFVFTSSCSVVFRGEPVENGTEDMPYTEASFWFKDPYALTKAEAERRVLASNGVGGMSTVAIRPHQIYGPGDRLYMPQVALRAKKLKIAMGTGKNKFVTTYVDNCVEGHILAAQALKKPNSPAAGQAYHINDGTVGNFWDMTFRIAAEVGGGDRKSMGKFWIPRPVALGMSWIAEIIGNITGQEVPLNWLATTLVTTDRTYSIAKAQRDLGYKPLVSMEDGFTRTIAEAKVQFAEQQRLEAAKPKERLPLLSYWLILVSLVSLFGTVQAFSTTDLLKQFQFNLAQDQVTPLAGRLFGCWTLLATLLRLNCALEPSNRSIYRLTVITFMVAAGFYGHNFLIAKTIDLRNVAMPLAFALPSLTWMLFFPPASKK